MLNKFLQLSRFESWWVQQMHVITLRMLLIWCCCPVSDCDETFNFIEPQHYLLYGSGMQTWEYSGQFALRSFLYLWGYTWPGLALQSLFPFWNTIEVYLSMRAITCFLACGCEMFFLAKLKANETRLFGEARLFSVFGLTQIVLAASMAVGHASFSTLPTSTCMSLLFVAMGCWLDLVGPTEKTKKKSDTSNSPRQNWSVFGVVFCAVASVLIGWPFAGLLYVPMALHLLVSHFKVSCVSLAVALIGCGIPAALFDTYYYRSLVAMWDPSQWTFASLNIVLYNVFGSEGRGPELYGVEPWHYFFRNLLLHFNVLFVLTMCVGPLQMLYDALFGSKQQRTAVSTVLLLSTPFTLWFLFWLRIPHKEDRFMVPAYGSFLIVASWSLSRLMNAAKGSSVRYRVAAAAVGSVLLLLFILFNVGRAFAMVHYYGDPQKMFTENYPITTAFAQYAQRVHPDRKWTVCVGAEWYRFPSHFFLPALATYGFLESGGFTGALPKPFRSPREHRSDMNDLNQPNQGQFTPLHLCDAVWGTVGELDAKYPEFDLPLIEDIKRGDDPAAYYLLDAAATPWWCRVLYVPGVELWQHCPVMQKLALRTRRIGLTQQANAFTS